MDTVKTPYFARAEAAIRALRDVENVSIQGEGETIREIHVLSRSNRAPKQIVRDIQTVLQARFNRSIDYRVVSVAYLGSEVATPAGNANGGALGVEIAPPAAVAPIADPAPGAAPAREPRNSPNAAVSPLHAAEPSPPPPNPSPPGSTARAAHAEATEEAEPRSPESERIRFGGVNLFVSGSRTQAQVELRWRGLPRTGSSSGWSTRDQAHRLVAVATLAAVQEFLLDEVALAVQDVEFLRLGKKRVAVVSLSMLAGRQEKLLVGSCVVEQDHQQAVVCATLAALNRLVAGLRPKEPTEYVLRPTSAK